MAIPPAPSFVEKLINSALQTKLTARWRDAQVIVRRNLALRGWQRLPGSTTTKPVTARESDLHVVARGEARPCLLSEQKVWDFDASLFDVAKLLMFQASLGSPSVYLVGADTPARFAKARPGVSFYDQAGAREWTITELIRGPWQSAWVKHLRNAGIAPLELPWQFTTTSIASAGVPAFAEHELRCVRIDAVDHSDVVRLRQGVMLGESLRCCSNTIRTVRSRTSAG